MQSKSFLLILVLTLHAQFVHAQWNRPLYNQLTKNLRSASQGQQKIRAMLAMGDYHVEQSYMVAFPQSLDTALSLAKQCEDLAKSTGSAQDLSDTYILYSKAYNYASRYPESINFARKAVDLSASVKNDTGVFNASRTLFRAFVYVYNTDSTRIITAENMSLAKKIGTKRVLGAAYEDLADNTKYRNLKNEISHLLDSAIMYYTATGKKDIQHLLTSQAWIYNQSGEHEKAFTTISKALNLAEELGDQTYYMIYLYDGYADISNKTERWETAEHYYQKALAVAAKYADRMVESDIALKLQRLMVKTGKIKESEDVIALIEKNYSQCNPTLLLQSLAAVLSHHISTGSYSRAEKTYQQLLPQMHQLNGRIERMARKDVYAALTQYHIYHKNVTLGQHYLDLYLETGEIMLYDKPLAHYMQFSIDSLNGNYIGAIRNYQLAGRYEDSIFNLHKNRQLTELEVQYDVDKRKKDNALLKQETELQSARAAKANYQKNLSLSGIILLSMIVGLIVRQYRLNQKRRKEIASKNRELEKLLTDKENLLQEKEGLLEEKDWLLKEIHHRVKNNLQVVMSLLNTQSYFLNDETAKEAIRNSQHRIHSMSLIHKKLYQSENISSVNMAVYFEELLDYYKIAFDTVNRIRFVLQAEPVELDPSQAVPVGLILNEAVNNALKHAFPDQRTGQITVSFKTAGQSRLFLSIRDNGIGMPGEISLSGFSSLGMKLIRGFSGELNGELKIHSAKGTEVSITFDNNNMAESMEEHYPGTQTITA
ncbi:tetratricopeptide repeat protein [Terrimonas sp. NA20]|uniref:histidine kinase n=1 Tax=Terrimonas ginsenosidimutans TaxID=2908004 RepID=A0ABS9KRY0_9BACT|nr:histidine kinase dimerization/phosphoacceptor domain -containing protein [Terrimonas ginsenosidimutans]MCG2615087.1 tetratricopeptide repeat protein [Terrimonas ginsenosidimutans]